ncbi:hypothetical protein DPMN_011308 [Dreissena polymorpha]|uniref:Uncharacterized protein n=1 Tax=Dreissena polymorpha TaxID=45954 RepID=A0A9D4N5V6_DREPO|nr:hypothetical protein DPMN_011308 [Dreissena polymorpha]
MTEKQVFSQMQLSSIKENLETQDSYVFLKKGNEEQYKVNKQALNKMNQAEQCLWETMAEHPSETVVSAHAKIREGIDIMSHRQN